MMAPRADRIALVVTDFESGGVERNFSNLMLGLKRLGIQSWFLVGDPRHDYLRDLAPDSPIERITEPRQDYLRHFLRQHRPNYLITGKLSDDLAALAARNSLPAEAGGATRLVAAVGTLMSGRFASHRWNWLKTWRDTRRIRTCYQALDGITAVSQEVADDLRHRFGITRVPIGILSNPILPEDLLPLAQAPCPHPWLADPRGTRPNPVILALGGLRQVKGFDTLLRSLACMDPPRARLIIIGEGKERHRLTALAEQLGISGRLDLAGFKVNPFPYLARADLLAISSRREGLPNALVEALALGIDVVATDCSGGIRTLLPRGEVGTLVPVDNPQALADAMSRILAKSGSGTYQPETRQALAEPYRLIPATLALVEFLHSLPARD